jgi:hypothetical protein
MSTERMLVHRSVAKVFGENLKVKVGEMLGWDAWLMAWGWRRT